MNLCDLSEIIAIIILSVMVTVLWLWYRRLLLKEEA